MKRSYLDYAMSVIVSRALPDVRDGLKPVHRRILFSMHESGYDWNKPYRKSARVVGDVMGKYHPHGDAAIYDAMVRMAQDFSMRLPLLDGQGNYGSMDGDPPAAMRYTEVRLGEPAHALLTDIDKETVDFQANYDESAHEPMVLPAAFPNLLVNGAGGIAVGMATNIPPHNLGEVVDAACACLDDPEITVDGLMEHVPGPDFPTGAMIVGAAGIRQAYHTGRGSVVMRGRTHVEKAGKDREAIIVTEIPYQVNKARMIERIAGLVNERRIEGIADLRDESDRDGVRVVIELRRSAMAEVVLNQLHRYSALQTSFGVNMLALRGGRPEMMTLRDIVAAFIDFREEVVTRRTTHLLAQARTRAHALAGLAIAVANIDEIIALIRAAKDPAAARAGLTGRDWPVKDAGPLVELIADPRQGVTEERRAPAGSPTSRPRRSWSCACSASPPWSATRSRASSPGSSSRSRTISTSCRTGTGCVRCCGRSSSRPARKFADARRTELIAVEFEHDVEDLIQREEMVVTLSHRGYVKRVPLSTYRAQRRGGKGRAGMSTRDEDFVSQVFVVNTHTPVLFFSTAGKVYKLKVYRLPQAAPQARGKALVNLLPLAKGETVSTILPMPEDEESWAAHQLMFATAAGSVRRNSASDFVNVPSAGKIAMKFGEDDRIVGVRMCGDGDHVLLAARGGKCTRFAAADVRLFRGRSSAGVRGMDLAEGDRVISMSILAHGDLSAAERDAYFGRKREGETATMVDERRVALAAREQFLLTVRSDGFGKRTSTHHYRLTRRGGKGIINMTTGAGKNGETEVVATFPVAQQDEIMLVTDGGQLIRCPVEDIRKTARGTRGVTIFRLGGKERVVSVARLADVNGNGAAGAAGAADAGAAQDG